MENKSKSKEQLIEELAQAQKKIKEIESIFSITRNNEIELKESQINFKYLYDSIKDAILIGGPYKNIIDCNPAFTSLFGYSKDEIIGKEPNFVFESEADYHNLEDLIEKNYNDGKSFSFSAKYKKKNGEIFDGETSVFYLKNDKRITIGIIGLIRDIGSKLQAEQEIQLLSQVVKTSPQFVVVTDMNGIITFINDAILERSDFSREEIIGNSIFNFTDEAGIKLLNETILPKLFEQSIWRGEINVAQNNNTYFPAFLNCSMLTDKNGNPKSLVAVFEDITKRKEVEEALINSEKKFRNLIELSTIAIFIHQGDNFVFTNKSMERQTGFGKTELMNRNFLSLVHPDDRDLVMERALKRLKNENVEEHYKIKIITKDNKIKWADFNGILIEWEGKPAILGFAYDITELINAEIAIKESEEKYRNLIEQSPVPILIHQGKYFVFSNKAIEQQSGYSKEELLKMNILEIVHPEDRDRVQNRVIKLLRNEILPKKHEFRIITKNGETKWTDFYGLVISYENQPAILGFAYDTTERKLAEMALKESEEKYRFLIEQMKDGIIQVDFDDVIQFVNNRFCELLGYSKEELIGKIGYELLLFDEDRELIKEKSRNRFKNKYDNYELRMKKKNGDTIYFIMSVSAIANQKGKVIGSMAICTDITERKEMEEKLKESEETYRNLFQNAQVGLFRTSIKNGKTLECNTAIAKMFGFDSREEALEKYIASENYVDPNVRKILLAELQEKGEVTNFVAEYYRKDKTTIWARFSAKLYPEKGWLEGVAEDITEKKIIEDKLLLSEEKFRSFFEDDLSGNFISTFEGKLLDCNQAFLNVFGFDSKEQALNTDMFDLYPEKKTRTNKINLLKEYGRLINYQETMRKINGEQIEILSNIVLERDNNGKIIGFKGYIIDISEQKKAEQELRQLAKLESLGILAGGIAHNIKNILAGISLNAGLIRIKPESSEKYLNNIERAIEQATVLANRFQTFAASGEPVKEVISIKGIIENAVSIALSGTKVNSNLHFDNDLWNIEADSKQLNEVFNNLFINANDAMPKGGTIRIKAENYIQTKNNSNLKEGIYIKVTVQDEGIGIPANIISQIFDPFFSTKSKGRGLGLSSIYYIIQKHKGYIDVHSVVGKGTQFDIYLPATEESIIVNEENKIELIQGNKKRILYLDDEVVLRENMSDIIELLDYEIDTAKDGYEAIGLYKKSIENNNKYDAVILDLTIQGSDLQGEDVLKELMKIDKYVKAVVFSGHSTKPIVAHYKDFGFAGRLEKPVSVEKLSRVLNEVLLNDTD